MRLYVVIRTVVGILAKHRRREPETGHLDVFRRDSAQQFYTPTVQAKTCGHNGPPITKNVE